ncbi:MAG: hypothetical protein M3416_17740 [Acidobacteriota bacterium]|nr:hypothetical protein [Acidobacteriota bacterium]
MWVIQWAKSATWRNEFNIPIRNFAKVSEGVYRGALPGADAYFGLVNKLGVRRILSLTEGARERDREAALAAGVTEWRHIPFADREKPKAERVREWLDIMRTAPTEGAIYTHCMGGRHRTGVLVAVLRVADQGWTKEQAFREMLHYGWYDARGHRPLREWFFRDFDPKDYAATDGHRAVGELADLSRNA